MPAQDLVTAEEAKTWLTLSGTSEDAKVATLITRASDWLEQVTLRKLKSRTFTNVRLTGPTGAKFYPPAWPIDVAQAITIKLDEAAQTVWKAESDGDVDAKDVVVASDDPFDERWGLRNHFYRWQGWESALGFGWRGVSTVPSSTQLGQHRLLLSYTGGYGTVPEDLKQACLYLLQKLWRDQEKQLTNVTSISVPAGGTVVLPKEPALPAEVEQLIAPYRRMAGGIFAGA